MIAKSAFFRVTVFAAAIAFTHQPSFGQVRLLKHFSLTHSSQQQSLLPPSNSVSHIIVSDSTVWIGTSKGLARSQNRGQTWESFRSIPAFADDGIFAVSVLDSLTWASTGFNEQISGGSVQTGSGYAYSSNGGATWQHVNQTLDALTDTLILYGLDTLGALPIVVPEQNVTFDISFSPGKVWIASWASGLRYTTNSGQTWQRIILPPDTRDRIAPRDSSGGDTLRFYVDPRRNNNFLAFSVLAVDNDTIWCGTAGGVNKSTNGGVSWARFTHQNQVSPILGNWVIAIKEQRFQNKRRIWTTNWIAENPNELFGVSYTEDGGRTWRNLLHGKRAYDFAFKDSIAYIATDDGLYRTDNGGTSFTRSGTIIDPTTRERITTSSVFSVGVMGDTVWAGTDDGLVSTIDNATSPFGSSWKIFRTYQQVGFSKTTYAYPNPFSPNSEITRIHYGVPPPRGPVGDAAVTIEIFDFGMNFVRTIIRSALRNGPGEYDEIWNGRDDGDRVIANGVYFYRVKVGGDEPVWGKVLVLR